MPDVETPGRLEADVRPRVLLPGEQRPQLLAGQQLARMTGHERDAALGVHQFVGGVPIYSAGRRIALFLQSRLGIRRAGAASLGAGASSRAVRTTRGPRPSAVEPVPIKCPPRA